MRAVLRLRAGRLCYVRPPAQLPAPTVDPAVSSLRVVSDPGDWVGNGQTFQYSSPDVTFSVVITDKNVVRLSVRRESPWVWWEVHLAAPDGQLLAPGYSPSALNASPFLPAGVPGLSLGGNGNGCNTVEAAFMVHQVAYDTAGNVTRLQATFEQHCEGQAPAARGEVIFTGNPPQ